MTEQNNASNVPNSTKFYFGESEKEKKLATEDYHNRHEGRGSTLAEYWPLACLVVVSGLAAWAISSGFGEVTMETFMHAYMGIFLTIFALLKLFDLKGFKDGFAMYDLLAKQNSSYGYVYPFIELGLGLAYFSFLAPNVTYVATIVVFFLGVAGVVRALQSGLDIDCPCMGNILSVPLSTVTLAEDIAMIVMAGILLAS